MNKKILVIDDEQSIRQTIEAVLTDEGYVVNLAADGSEALEYLAKNGADLILLDVWMPGMDGLEVLSRIRQAYPEQMVIMMSGHGSIENAVRATKLGAFDFIEKPISLERLLVLVQNSLGVRDLAIENQALRKQVAHQKTLLGDSPAVRQLRELIARVAPTTASVLITGENGTGKELVAHSLHLLSQRFSKPFIDVNCAAIPEELIESELFGHEKGAFTGATQLKKGKFDLANGGTLFLDEIGDMSLKTQAKVLRILQEQKFERVGGTQTLSVDVRIVAATNKDLRVEIQKGLFREDLFYRLNVIPFLVPPLRERGADAALLARHFLQEFTRTHARPARALAPEAERVLQSYGWPGNVRELKNLIERLVILTPDSEALRDVTAADILEQTGQTSLAFSSQAPPAAEEQSSAGHLPAVGPAAGNLAGNLKDARQNFERDYIQRTLTENAWNVSKAAAVLGVERAHLHRKISALGIKSP